MHELNERVPSGFANATLVLWWNRLSIAAFQHLLGSGVGKDDDVVLIAQLARLNVNVVEGGIGKLILIEDPACPPFVYVCRPRLVETNTRIAEFDWGIQFGVRCRFL